jgi:basic membrane protein A
MNSTRLWFLNVFLSFLIIILLSTIGCAPVIDEPDCHDPDQICIGLVTDVGSINDKSFNQSAWLGVEQAVSKLDAHANYIETRDAKDYSANIELFANKGYDIIVTVGFGLGEATGQAARKYPEIHFIGVDQFQPSPIVNVAGLIFREDHAGFLAGALAAKLSKSNIIAAVFGTDLVPPIVAFKKGYESGARFIKPGIKIISTYHPGGLDVAFTDPEWGASTAKQAIDQGADVVFSAGGTTGNGGLIETASHKDKYCIGVDTDQWLTLPETHPCLVSCAVKQITTGVYDLITLSTENKFPNGNFYGEVGLSPFHDFDSILSKEIKNTLIQIDKDLRNNTIKPFTKN